MKNEQQQSSTVRTKVESEDARSSQEIKKSEDVERTEPHYNEEPSKQNSAPPVKDVLNYQTKEKALERMKNRKPKVQPKRKKLDKALFSFSDHRAGNRNSRPVQYGLNVTLTRLNMEFGSEKDVHMANSANKIQPRFNPLKAKEMEIVGNIKVGQTIPDSSARHILILTTWRSGSTFLGDLLNHYKGVFYYFEPLHYYSKEKNKNDQKPVQTRPDFLKSLFQCQYNKDNIGYLHHASKADNKFLFKNHNFRLWNTCHNLLPNDMMCYMPDYLNTVCPMYPIKLIKTVRLQMKEIEPLIEDPSLGLKIVFLVRDPRGTYNSRSAGPISKWCVRDACSNPVVGCDELLDNYEVCSSIQYLVTNSVI